MCLGEHHILLAQPLPGTDTWQLSARFRVDEVAGAQLVVLGLGDGAVHPGRFTDAPGSALFADSSGALGWVEVRDGAAWYWSGSEWQTSPATIAGTEGTLGTWCGVEITRGDLAEGGLAVELSDAWGTALATIEGLEGEATTSFLGAHARDDAGGAPQSGALRFDDYTWAAAPPGETFAPLGTLTIDPFDAGEPVSWGSIGVGSALLPGTGLRFQVRAAQELDSLFALPFTGPDGSGETWFEGGEALGAPYDGTRFLQWRAELESAEAAASPTLQDVTVTRQPLPVVSAVDPSVSQPGETVLVTVSGSHFDVDTTLDLGGDVVVGGLQILSSHNLTASATVAAGAAPGRRDVTVTSDAGAGSLVEGFAVAGVTGTNTPSGAQGTTLTAELVGLGFAAPLEVDLGAGITVQGVSVTGPELILADLAIAADAPLGARDVAVTMGGVTTSVAGAFEVTPAGACGDGALDPGEACDDGALGNGAPGGGCSADCQVLDPIGLLTDGLVGSWRFEGDATDASPYGNDGELAGGATFGAGPSGQAVALGGDGYVEVPHSASLDLAGPMTVQIWLKSTGSQAESLFLVADKSHGFTDTTGWYLQGTSWNGKLTFGFGDGIGWGGVTSPEAVLDSEWHQVVGTWDGAEICLYLDGEQSGCEARTGPIGTNDRPVRIGAAWGGGELERWFSGAVDDFALWNVALTPAEVSALFGGTAPGSACGDGVQQAGEVCDDGNTTDGDGCAADCGALGLGLVSVTPRVVSAGVPTVVTLAGERFGTDLTIDIGADIAVEGVTVLSDGLATAVVTPAAGCACGLEDVVIASGGVTASLSGGLAVLTVTGVEGGSVVVGGSTTLVVEGTGFLAGGGAEQGVAADLGAGVAVLAVDVISPTRVDVKVVVDVAAFFGLRDLEVTVGAASASWGGALEILGPAPTLTAIEPDFLAVGTTVPCSLAGTGFAAGMDVDLGVGVVVTDLVVLSGGEASFVAETAPQAALGLRPVRVTTSSGTAELEGGVEVGEFALAGLDPAAGAVGEEVVVTVTGFGITGQTTFDFGPGITVAGVEVLDSGTAEVTLDIGYQAKAPPRDVSGTVGGATSVLSEAFEVLWPQLTVDEIKPRVVSPDVERTLNLIGAGFTPGDAVAVEGGSTLGVLYWSGTLSKPTVHTPATPGWYDVTVTNGGNEVLLGDALEVFGPTAITPGGLAQGASVAVAITGFGFTTGVTVSAGAGITTSGVQVVSATELTAVLTAAPDAPLGAHAVQLDHAASDLHAVLPASFTVTGGGGAVAAPALDSVAPASAYPGQTVTLTLQGAGFTEGAVVGLGPAAAVGAVTALSDTTLQAVVTFDELAAPGALDLALTTEAGAASLASAFTVLPLPLAVTGVDVQPVFDAGAAVTMTLSGTGFSWGTTVDAGGGAEVTGVAALSQTALQVTLTMGATPGVYDVTATNGPAQAVAEGLYLVFGIATLAPAEVLVGASAALTLTGGLPQNTLVGVAGDGVELVGAVADGTTLTGTVTVAPDASVGPRDVTALWNGREFTLPGGLTVALGDPVVEAITPDVLELQQSRTLTLDGYALQGAVVDVQGPVTVHDVTVVSPYRVELALSSGAETGLVDLIVTNVAGGVLELPGAIEVAVPSPKAPMVGGSVAILAPAAGSAYSKVGGQQVDVELFAEVADFALGAEGTLRVFLDGLEVASLSSTAPYTFTDLPAGRHVLAVALYDLAGDLANSPFAKDSLVVTVAAECESVQDCADGNACTASACTAGVCGYGASSGGCCGSDLECGFGQACVDQVCVACVADVDCIDGIACSFEGCDAKGSCSQEMPADCCADVSDCDDGKDCSSETCEDNTCVFLGDEGCCGADAECDDGDPCTVDRCIAEECRHGTKTLCCTSDADCDDGSPCTEDACDLAKAACVWTQSGLEDCCQSDLDCKDGDACTTNTCDPANHACVTVPNGSCCNFDEDCDDGIPCNRDRCIGHKCRFGPSFDEPYCCAPGATAWYLQCDDGNPCTADACDGSSFSCLFQDLGQDACCVDAADCDDANPATIDTCTAGLCSFHDDPLFCQAAADCDDGNPCTAETCLANTCAYQAVEGCCTSNAHCADGDLCTLDVCDPSSATCSNPPKPDCCKADDQCDDGSPCTADRCVVFKCRYRVQAGCCATDAECHDGDPCTTSVCQWNQCATAASGACADEPTGVLHTFDTGLAPFTATGSPTFQASGGAATLSIDAAPWEATLLGPAVDALEATKLTLQFTQVPPDAGTAEARISIDGGATWTTVHSQPPGGPAGTFVSVDLTGLADGQGDVRVAFVWSGAADTAGASWTIDDVVLGAGTVPFLLDGPPAQGLIAPVGATTTDALQAFDADPGDSVTFVVSGDLPFASVVEPIGATPLFGATLAVTPAPQHAGQHEGFLWAIDGQNLRQRKVLLVNVP